MYLCSNGVVGLPAQNILPFPDSTMARQSGSLSSSWKTLPISLKNKLKSFKMLWKVSVGIIWKHDDLSMINCCTYHQSSLVSAFIFLGLLSCTLYTKGLTSSTMRFFQSPLVLEAVLVLKYANEYYVKFMPCGILKPFF